MLAFCGSKSLNEMGLAGGLSALPKYWSRPCWCGTADACGERWYDLLQSHTAEARMFHLTKLRRRVPE
ncbi:MAG: hypothetical protein ACRD6I_16880, partial [Candidatus Acidiferrales bacterium]